MTDLKSIANTFFNQKLKREDKLLYIAIAINALVGLTLILVNHFTHQFQGNEFFSAPWERATIPLIFLSLLVVYFRDIVSERVGLVIHTFAFYCLALSAGLLLAAGIQVTPFPTIDHWLLAADLSLGFHQSALITAVSHIHWLQQIFYWAYDMLIPELTLVPFVMAFLLCKRSVWVFLFSMVTTYLVGTLIYYFFPTAAPASVIHNPHFTYAMHDTYLKFYEIHHHLKVTATDGGLIAFPSFHVIWACLVVYATRHKKWLFYPALICNAFLIGSTVCLGWHYLLDVLASFVIAGAGITIAEKLYSYCKNGGYLMTRKWGRPLRLGGVLSSGGKSSPSSSSLKTMPRPFS